MISALYPVIRGVSVNYKIDAEINNSWQVQAIGLSALWGVSTHIPAALFPLATGIVGAVGLSSFLSGSTLGVLTGLALNALNFPANLTFPALAGAGASISLVNKYIALNKKMKNDFEELNRYLENETQEYTLVDIIKEILKSLYEDTDADHCMVKDPDSSLSPDCYQNLS